jgi:5-formyltetrahydrofolate cyclo-ligase
MPTHSSSSSSRDTQRRTLRSARRALSPAERSAASLRACGHLLAHPWYRRARSIALYHPVGSEADSSALFVAAGLDAKQIFLPSILYRGSRLLFVRLRPGARFTHSRHGIPQPRPARSGDLAAKGRLDLVLVPLLGFDAKGNRLGSGAGYYDRSFDFRRFSSRNRPRLVGLAFACQQTNNLKPAAWDIPLDAVATEDGLTVFR